MMNVTLNSGHVMPILGCGTSEVRGEAMVNSILDAALGAGYRAFDFAEAYNNEEEAGNAFKLLLPKHNLTRKDVFITSKLAPKSQGREGARKACLQTLAHLQMDYLDLYLIHWPGSSGIPIDDPKNKENRQKSWEELELLVKEGKIRSIGVSNYMVKHLQQLLSHCSIKPAVNQCEHHPYCRETSVRELCRENGILYQAYSSLGSPKSEGALLKNETVVKISVAHNKSPAQVLLRWAVDDGIGILPRSSNPDRVKANIDIFDFKLSQEEISAINAVNKEERYCGNPNTIA